MLFILTGDIQIGKTRWLEELVHTCQQQGVEVAGVLAPGQWVTSTGPHADTNGFEKRGINNVLLPQKERLLFAKRNDIALEENDFDAQAQAAQAKLGWHISEEALQKVNNHFAHLHQEAGAPSTPPRLLIIDELGRLELMRNGGLTEALSLLEEGPTEAFPHALIVVRDALADTARARFESTWGEVRFISPTASAQKEVLSTIL
jgi:nucleoside-triphosphatase THEP1